MNKETSHDTKRRIIKAGAELIHQRGFNNTGLKDILEAADVPKGSFYFYFKNKEAFGIEVLAYFGENFHNAIQATLHDPHKSPIEQLRSLFDRFHEFFKASGFSKGCPIGNLAQELGDIHELFRINLDKAMDGMTNAIMQNLQAAQEAGEIPADLDTGETALFIVSAWHGAIIRMKVTKNSIPLDIFYKFVFDNLLK